MDNQANSKELNRASSDLVRNAWSNIKVLLYNSIGTRPLLPNTSPLREIMVSEAPMKEILSFGPPRGPPRSPPPGPKRRI